MKFKDNLECTYHELYSWDYDEGGFMYPSIYELVFEFYGTRITAWIRAEELQDDAGCAFCQVETSGELLASFEEVFENNDNFRDKLKAECKKCWEEELDTNEYNYQGLKE